MIPAENSSRKKIKGNGWNKHTEIGSSKEKTSVADCRQSSNSEYHLFPMYSISITCNYHKYQVIASNILPEKF